MLNTDPASKLVGLQVTFTTLQILSCVERCLLTICNVVVLYGLLDFGIETAGIYKSGSEICTRIIMGIFKQ